MWKCSALKRGTNGIPIMADPDRRHHDVLLPNRVWQQIDRVAAREQVDIPALVRRLIVEGLKAHAPTAERARPRPREQTLIPGGGDHEP